MSILYKGTIRAGMATDYVELAGPISKGETWYIYLVRTDGSTVPKGLPIGDVILIDITDSNVDFARDSLWYTIPYYFTKKESITKLIVTSEVSTSHYDVYLGIDNQSDDEIYIYTEQNYGTNGEGDFVPLAENSGLEGNFIPVVMINKEKCYLSTTSFDSNIEGVQFKIKSQIHTARLYEPSAPNSTPIRIKKDNKIYALGTMPGEIIAASCTGTTDSEKNKTYIYQFKKKQLVLLTILPFHVTSLGYIPNFHLYIITYTHHYVGGSGLNVWTSIGYGQQFSFDGVHWIDNDGFRAYYYLFGKERLWLLGKRYISLKKRYQWVVYELKNDAFKEVQVVSDGDSLFDDPRLSIVGFDFNLNFYARGTYDRYLNKYEYYICKLTTDGIGSYYLSPLQYLGFLTDGQNQTLDMAKKSCYHIDDITDSTMNIATKKISFTTSLLRETYTLEERDSLNNLNISGNGVNQTVSVSPHGASGIVVAKVFYEDYIKGIEN